VLAPPRRGGGGDSHPILGTPRSAWFSGSQHRGLIDVLRAATR